MARRRAETNALEGIAEQAVTREDSGRGVGAGGRTPWEIMTETRAERTCLGFLPGLRGEVISLRTQTDGQAVSKAQMVSPLRSGRQGTSQGHAKLTGAERLLRVPPAPLRALGALGLWPPHRAPLVWSGRHVPRTERCPAPAVQCGVQDGAALPGS